ncbi:MULTISPECIES: prepilin-type N-terminal cleavage/methylation domain-containing protein [Ramlibacter]|uniref:Prepilin-type N-terminal cleavage/methylation domain-containing protein n=1 Tax=Ramlibacter aquaticus TaxID=2780094 RepID=A0ABR9SAB5_9BURK|nr:MULTISPECIES: prepilin-type N-terminal cleavage/methylation domain-containing protein [Ramlibacter]MBE7939293.1 prepilin-type N-terminal cleavage/methylation domain-containing protein [Ramlibacter aquaticus]
MRQRFNSRPTSQGFTLIELVITLILLGILAVLSSSIFYDNVQTSVVRNKAQGTADQGRYVMERIARELREIKYDTTAGAYSITSSLSGTQTSLIFTRSVPNAANTAFTDTPIALCYNSATKTLSLNYNATACPTTTPTAVLTTQAAGFSLVFADGNNNLSTGTIAITTATVRGIEVTLQMLDSGGTLPSGQAINQTMRVSLRNL